MDNPKAYEETTGPEIWQQMEHKLDAIVSGVGKGGHFTGLVVICTLLRCMFV